MSSRQSLPVRPTGDIKAPLLAVEHLSKTFGSVTAIKDVSLSVDCGEICAICGENGAGKSTLVKILSGVLRPDQGTILIDGKKENIRHPKQAQALGISLVAQELSLTPHLSIEDNIWLGNSKVPLLYPRRQTLREQARQALELLGAGHLGLKTLVGSLKIGDRQLVEIARMLTRDARVLILDEPTASLSDIEIDRIQIALRALRSEGRAILYVTHRLGEVFEICDTATILRNGELVRTCRVEEIDRDDLIEMMLGQAMGQMYPASTPKSGAPMLIVEHLHLPEGVEDFSMVESPGQIVCLTGQIGSGTTEVVRTLAGLVPNATGRVLINGKRLKLGSVRKALKSNVVFISEDRAGEGIFLRMRVLENLVATRLGAHARAGLLSWSRLRTTASTLASRVGLDGSRLGAWADQLSGGNQQKLAFGRAIGSARPGLFLMNEPTRGVDVGARSDIYRRMRELCDLGYLLVMTSSDLEEVLGVSDIIITLYRGKQVNRYLRDQVTMHQVLSDITHPMTALS